MTFQFGRKPGKKSYSDDYLSTIRTNVIKNPGNTAVLFGDARLTWQDVWERSNKLGNALITMGLNRHDRVMIFLPNCMEYPEVILGVNKAGLVTTGCNYRLTGPEVAYQINDSGARAIILQGTDQLEAIQAIRDQTPALEHIIMIGQAPKGVIAYQEALDSASAEDPPVEADSGEVHTLMYTSGTTGKPKAAARTYKSDYHMANAVCHALGLRSDDVYLAVAPMYAAASLGYVCATMLSGGTVVVIPSFVPAQIPSQIEKFKPTWFFMVPIMYEWMLNQSEEVFNSRDFSSVRALLSCGAPLYNATAQKIMERFPHAEVSNWLGASEFGFISSYTFSGGTASEGCVGKPVLDLELAVLDEDGNLVPEGEPGILYGRGFSMWEGYLNKPEATAEAYLDHEWGTVGDVVRKGEDGNFYVLDRKKDMIITGGMNVYPVEIENVVMTHEAVADVAVIGVPDEKWGEAVKALVVKAKDKDLDEGAIISLCRENLAGFKVPKSVEFIDQVPRSMIGKALKTKLREKYWEGKKTVI